MKSGARFTTSNKEGDTNITWNGSRFVRIDHRRLSRYGRVLQRGGIPGSMLRKFYDWETSKNVYPEKVSDLVAWKLILRLLRS
jgi:hypothetical protein